jgi:hypothetical protein
MFLIEGLELVDNEEEVVPTTIVQSEDDGPAFVVDVRIMPIKEYRKVFSKLNREQTGGFRANNSAQDKMDKDYLDRVIVSWKGLTIANWESIVRDGKKFEGPNVEKLRKSKAEIPHSPENAFYLYRNTWPQDFGNKIFDVVQAGAEAQEAEEEELKKA